MGQLSNSMGQWMDQVTRGWLIYQLTGSPLQLGLATATRGLPLLFFGIIAGAFADRSGRKAQLIVAQVTNAFLNVTLATLVITGMVEPWHVYVSGFLAGSVQAFQQPARQTLISDIVGNEKLINALALNSTAVNCSRAIGPAIAGGFITLVGVGGSYYLQGALYAFATLWTAQMRIPERSAASRLSAQEPFFKSIATGFRYVSSNSDIRTLMLLALGPLTFGMSYTSLMPIVARVILHGGAALQGILLSCIGIGSLCGALTVASIRRDNGYGLPVVLGALGFSTSIFLFGSSHWVWLTIPLGFVLGAFSVSYNTQNQALLQILAPRHLRGRIMSIFALDRGLVPLGALLAGALASEFGGANAIRIMSGTAFTIVILVVITSPGILRLKVPLRDYSGDEFGDRIDGRVQAPAGFAVDGAAREIG